MERFLFLLMFSDHVFKTSIHKCLNHPSRMINSPFAVFHNLIQAGIFADRKHNEGSVVPLEDKQRLLDLQGSVSSIEDPPQGQGQTNVCNN